MYMYIPYIGTGVYFSENSGGLNRVLVYPIKFMHFSAVDCRLHQKKSGVFQVSWLLTVVTTTRLYLKVAIFSIIDCHSHLGASFLPIFNSACTRSSLLPRLPLSFINQGTRLHKVKFKHLSGLNLYFPGIPKLIRLNRNKLKSLVPNHIP